MANDPELVAVTEALNEAARTFAYRIASVGGVFTIAVILSAVLAELINNHAFLASRLIYPYKSSRNFHWILSAESIPASDLFVVATAMLAVCATINLGVAVMPKLSVTVRGRSATSPQDRDIFARARAVIWTKCLGLAAYWASLIAGSCAMLSWLAGPNLHTVLRSVVLTSLALLTLFVAANVVALADDDANRLTGWRLAFKRNQTLLLGLSQLPAWAKLSQSKWRSRIVLAALEVACWVVSHILVVLMAELFFTPLNYKDFKSASTWTTPVIVGLAIAFAALPLICITITIASKYFGWKVRHAVFGSRRLLNGKPWIERATNRAYQVVYTFWTVLLLSWIVAIAFNFSDISTLYAVSFFVMWIVVPHLRWRRALRSGKGIAGIAMLVTVRTNSRDADQSSARLRRTETDIESRGIRDEF